MPSKFFAISLVLAAASLSACGQAEQATTPTAAPTFVETLSISRAEGYASTSSYAGRVEAALDSALAFEIGGSVVELVADEGDAVSRGDVLARLDTARLDALRAEANAGLAQVDAELALANSTYERVADAYSYKGVSKQELDEAEQRVLALAASRDVAAANLERIDVDIAKSTLTAAFDGTVTRRHVDPGTVLAAGAPVLRLQSNKQLEARVGVSPLAATSLQPGESYTLMVDGSAVSAQLRAVVDMRDEMTRTVDALFAVVDPGDTVRPGDTAILETQTWNDTPGFWLPLTSLVEGSRGLWQVLVADSDGNDGYILEGHVLEVLHSDSERAFARGTLRTGDLLVSTGSQRVVAGQAVRIGTVTEPERVAIAGDIDAD
ncbi:MAG: efflux RND transporter periplasmic adaptor subunit [Pseudomonadota bacterium]